MKQDPVFEEAVAYHRRFKPQALLIAQRGNVAIESFDGGFHADEPHALFSGTKSFWGVTALTAQGEGVLELDEAVAETFPAWSEDPWKRRVTLRDLLTLTAGVPFGGLGSSVPSYEKALATDLRDEPGTKFTYGGIPLQIFGAVFAAKLSKVGLTPHEYLQARILRPNAIDVSKWRVLRDGTQPLPTGAFLRTANWLAYGTFVLANYARFAECFCGTTANPRYGLGWWLAPERTPQDAFYASGSGGQALYVVPSLEIVAARFASGGSFNHAAFLKRLGNP